MKPAGAGGLGYQRLLVIIQQYKRTCLIGLAITGFAGRRMHWFVGAIGFRIISCLAQSHLKSSALDV